MSDNDLAVEVTIAVRKPEAGLVIVRTVRSIHPEEHVKLIRSAFIFGALALAAACSDSPVSQTQVSVTGNLKFVNGFNGPVTVLVDGTPVLTNVALGAAAGADIAAGQHSIQLQAAGGAAGATKLRVGNFAASAATTPISIWRTQPDYQSMIRIQFPFPYQTTSPYLQSTPGGWRIMVSHENNTQADVPMPDTLANSGLISVPSGQSRTVIITDGATAGTYSIVVIEP